MEFGVIRSQNESTKDFGSVLKLTMGVTEALNNSYMMSSVALFIFRRLNLSLFPRQMRSSGRVSPKEHRYKLLY